MHNEAEYKVEWCRFNPIPAIIFYERLNYLKSRHVRMTKINGIYWEFNFEVYGEQISEEILQETLILKRI